MKTIAVDFDGVIHKYSKGWFDGAIYDEPIEGAIESLNKLKLMGFEVVVFTTREASQVSPWLAQYGLGDLKVTNIKIPAIAYIDDRGIRFTNWKDILNYFY